MKKKVVIAGGTGFIGQYLESKYRKLGYEVLIVSRQAHHISWADKNGIIDALEQAELIINLAGKSVNCRYNEENKKEILDSRTQTTKILGDAILACKNPPQLWVNSSTATVYRHSEDRPMTEASGEIGTGFSVEIAKEWEKSFFAFQLPQTRQVALRIAIVLGKDGGAMEPYINLVRFGLGGVQGSGKQKFSWIHIEDLYQIISFIQSKKDLSGIFNCSSPQIVTNREFMMQLRNTMNRKIGLPAPKWMLEMGAIIMRTETELILKSRWVAPERLLQEGYQFTFDRLDKALQQIIKSPNSIS